jgi:anti-sigma regulatory factor (Ser/Thr protein kinase)
MAVDEAITNAHEHGNMALRGQDRDFEEYPRRLMAREKEAPYAGRKLHVSCSVSQDAVVYRIRDDGKGFDHSALPDPSDPDNLFKVHGRGIMLMRLSVDDVRFNDSGNEVLMIKRANGKVDHD